MALSVCAFGVNVIAVWELKWQLLNEVPRETHFFFVTCEVSDRKRLSHTQTQKENPNPHTHTQTQAFGLPSALAFLI